MIWRAAIWFSLFACVAQAKESTDHLVATGVKEFTTAYRAWDGERFGAAAELFRQACTNAPGSSTNFYWLGAAQFHRMLQLQNPPAPPASTLAADAAMDTALAAFQKAVKLDARHAESHALLGTLYGMKIKGNLVRGARYGPRVAKHRQKAMEFGAQNPRVRYLLGTCQFHTARKPAARREALASFLAAEELFIAESQRGAGPLEPRWGRSTCLTFIGRTYELLGQRAEAAVYFRRALAEHPADFVARDGLARVTERQSK
jgi:tetratricopeptide (TPR) repeat protein